MLLGIVFVIFLVSDALPLFRAVRELRPGARRRMRSTIFRFIRTFNQSKSI